MALVEPQVLHRSYLTSSLVLPNSVFVLLIRDAENVPVFKRRFDGLYGYL
ncbi:hypothetical protein J507_3689 [Acinetobacter sp. 1295259]|nr:hypothetical protein J507_3689 [Acinetobacter sp. 1295259]